MEDLLKNRHHNQNSFLWIASATQSYRNSTLTIHLDHSSLGGYFREMKFETSQWWMLSIYCPISSWGNFQREIKRFVIYIVKGWPTKSSAAIAIGSLIILFLTCRCRRLWYMLLKIWKVCIKVLLIDHNKNYLYLKTIISCNNNLKLLVPNCQFTMYLIDETQ